MNEIPEELLDLLMASFLYINSKVELSNPFVRSFGATSEQEAFDLLCTITKQAEYLLPEVEKLNKNRMETVNQEEKNFILKQQADGYKEC